MAKQFKFYVYGVCEPYNDQFADTILASNYQEAENKAVPPDASWWNSFSVNSLFLGAGGEIHLNPRTFAYEGDSIEPTRVKVGDSLEFPTNEVIDGRLAAVYNGEPGFLVGIRATKKTDRIKLEIHPPTGKIENIVVAGRYIDIYYEGGGFVRLPR